MEFPNTGIQCFVKECKQLDFLPIECKHCSNMFCKDHFNLTLHSCFKFTNNFATGIEKTSNFYCSHKKCKDKSSVEMPCSKCKKHFCLTHRYHDCFEQDLEKQKTDLIIWNKPKVEFSKAKIIVDQEITNKIKKSKNSAVANKVQLMRLKMKSIGDKSIPTTDRCYFLVHLPICRKNINFDNSKGVYVSMNWSIGKVIDSIADLLKIPNFNNDINAKKLRIFHYPNGNIIANQMDLILVTLMESGTIVDGHNIILEYSSSEKIDWPLYSPLQ